MRISPATAILCFVGMGVVCLGAIQSAAAPPQAARTDLNAALSELQRVASATSADIANLRIDKWGASWKVWKGRAGQKKEDMEHIAASLQKNLSSAIPGLIKDVQAAHGSLSSTFKLYHDVDVVHEYLGRLAEAAEVNGKKEEYQPLSDDVAALEGLRGKLSSYIEQAAAALESSGKLPVMSSAATSTPGQLPKKIVVDDPASKKTKKKP
ncbi:MAG TPA: hypothetical protein VNW97_00940 [Candidatus Saccharimonadales bacterium]|jgi:hypothetical protein|nr:hypothetical protein [Candidatus Saccharimonadales bacterium]